MKTQTKLGHEERERERESKNAPRFSAYPLNKRVNLGAVFRQCFFISKKRLSRLLILLLIIQMSVGVFVFPVNQAEATGRTYYVSVADGNDTYDGTEETHTTGNTGPWQTIAKVNGLACGSGAGQLYAGDTVKFKTGETWREQLIVPCSGTSGNSITFGAYGESGANPIVDGSDLVTGWSNTNSLALNLQVTTSLDDAWDYGAGTLNNNGATLYMSVTGVTPTAGMRFQNVTVPKSITINSAVFSVYAYPGSGDITTTMYGEAADNAVDFTSSIPSARARTTANVPWISTASEQWVSKDLTTIVQEIVNRSGWASGNALDIISNPGSPTTVGTIYTYDTAPNLGAKLVIGYNGTPITNVYHATLATTPTQVFFSGTRGIPVANKEALVANYDWWYDSVNSVLAPKPRNLNAHIFFFKHASRRCFCFLSRS